MGKFNDEMDKLNDKQDKKKSTYISHKCSIKNCPMKASSGVNGFYTCAFHDGTDFHEEVTTAIKANKTFIQGYNNMVKWSSADWYKHQNYLINHKNIPMNQGEMPTSYLDRYFKWISDKINNEATIQIERQNQYQVTGSFKDGEQ